LFFSVHHFWRSLWDRSGVADRRIQPPENRGVGAGTCHGTGHRFKARAGL